MNSRVPWEVLWSTSCLAVIVGPVDGLLTLQKFLGTSDIASDAALLCTAVVICVLSACLATLHLIIAAIWAPIKICFVRTWYKCGGFLLMLVMDQNHF